LATTSADVEVEAAENPAFVGCGAVARGRAVVVLEEVDGFDAQRLGAASAAGDPGAVGFAHLVSGAGHADRAGDLAVAETALGIGHIAFRLALQEARFGFRCEAP